MKQLQTKKSYKRASIAIVALVLMSGLFSCVGTIEDKNPQVTKGASTAANPIKFEGIFKAVAIADTKIDVFFYPSSLEPKRVTYLISYDGLTNPISVPGTTLTTDYKGLLKYTVTGLGINQNYTFSIQAKNDEGSISSNTVVSTEKTFSNITADFSGISTIRNLAGEDGRTALRIEWPAAVTEGNLFYPKEIDPNQYEIILLNAGSLTPASFDDDFFGEPNRKVFYVAGTKVAHQVNGLTPGTKYFVRVRAIHQGYVDYGANVDYKREQNSNYLLAQTLSDDASSVKVDLASMTVDILSLNSASLQWGGATGPFVEYRVYYRNIADGGLSWSGFRTSKNIICDGPDAIYPEWGCKKVSFAQNTTQLADLDPLADYDMYVVICMTSTCDFSNTIEYQSNSPYKIYPGISNFSGITTIDQPKYFWAVDQVYLNINTPDFSSGALDGLLVELKARAEDDGPTYDSILNHPVDANTTNFTVGNFDYNKDTIITVSGLDPQATEQYCFSILPYIYNQGVIQISRDGAVTKCILPQIALPDELQFDGLNLSSTIADGPSNTISLNWTAPTGGVYDKMKIFIRAANAGEAFNFSDAVIPGSADYVTVEVPYGTTSYTFSSLPDGIYKIGILPYYSNSGVYSPYNSNIYTFDTSL